jgi:hypothetical protein
MVQLTSVPTLRYTTPYTDASDDVKYHLLQPSDLSHIRLAPCQHGPAGDHL